MSIHVLLLKFDDQRDKAELISDLKRDFTRMGEEIDIIDRIEFRENSYEREDNMDICITFEVKKENLSDYLNHPAHQEFLSNYAKYFEKKATMDYEVD